MDSSLVFKVLVKGAQIGEEQVKLSIMRVLYRWTIADILRKSLVVRFTNHRGLSDLAMLKLMWGTKDK